MIEALSVLDSLEANDDLRALSVVSYPQMKKEARSKLYKEMVKRRKLSFVDPDTGASTSTSGKALTMAELARFMSGA